MPVTDPGVSVDPAMPNYGGMSPYGMGMSPYGGMPMGPLSMLGGVPDAQPSKYAESLYQAGQELTGQPGTADSPLAQIKSAEAERLAKIQRAMQILQASGQGNDHVNLPMLALGAGLMGPSGSATGMAMQGDAYRGMGDQIAKQREIDRAIAEQTSNLTLSQGNVPWQTMQERQNMGERMNQAAAQAETRDAMAQAREYAARAGFAGRIGSAEIGANAKVRSADIAAQKNPQAFLYNLYMQAHADEPDGPAKYQAAMDYMTGKKAMSPDELNLQARTQAQKEYSAMLQDPRAFDSSTYPDFLPKDPHAWIDHRTAEIIATAQAARHTITNPAPAPRPQQGQTAPNGQGAPKVSPLPALKDRVPGKTTWAGPKGTYLWDGKGWNLQSSGQ